MAFLGSIGNIISRVSPVNGTSNVPVDSVITVSFTYDMVPSTITDDKNNLSGTIVLLDDGSNKIPCHVTYENKVATLKPDVILEPKMRYQVIIKGGLNGIKSVTGTTLLTDYNFNFETADAIPPGKVSLVAPVDRSVFSGITEFVWSSVTGFNTYEFQISHESKFGSTIFSSIVVGNSITPDIVFEHDQVYHWRVRAISNSTTPITGPWSDTWQFRFNISAPIAPGVPITPSDGTSSPLDIVTVVPGPDEYFVVGLDTISVQFTDDIDPDTVTDKTFVVKVDYIDLAGEPTQLMGYYVVTGSIVQFHFTYPLETTPTNPDVVIPITTLPYNTNTIFTVELSKQITSMSGASLADDISWTFATVFTPYYSKVVDVRSELRNLIDDVSDLEIMRMIHTVSQWADQIAYAPYGTQNRDFVGETQQDTTNSIFYHNYVRYESALRLLNQKTILRSSSRQGGMKQIGDLIVKDPMYLSPDFKIALKQLEALRNRAQMYLTIGIDRTTFPFPRYAIKGENVYTYPLNKRNSF